MPEGVAVQVSVNRHICRALFHWLTIFTWPPNDPRDYLLLNPELALHVCHECGQSYSTSGAGASVCITPPALCLCRPRMEHRITR